MPIRYLVGNDAGQAQGAENMKTAQKVVAAAEALSALNKRSSRDAKTLEPCWTGATYKHIGDIETMLDYLRQGQTVGSRMQQFFAFESMQYSLTRALIGR